MLVRIPQVLNAEQLAMLREQLDHAGDAWVDGRVTAGYSGAPVKFNQQIDERSEAAAQCQHLVLSALERNPLFISAVLPNIVYPPMFNRYSEGMTFGLHVDGGVRLHPHNGRKLRTDVSATLFLSDPASYDGGELQIEDTYGVHSVKLAAGDMVVYPSTSLHQVTPITRGVRVGCFFWIQSLIRDDGQRALLFDMDNAIQTLNQTNADERARRTLVGCYHNLLRQWSDT
ncbi:MULTISPECIES: Fe2+-dependent dioxygenase [Cupriavidus]|jgi:PKHD-type hydroxylase|uniref:Fe2+-dependent dioxygenase n=1 Tax=Cupriavidus metallidurans TaxID=119219 RepID=A0A2L0XA70_9BURK|nr:MULTISPECIES: Fe2+-dependent dioxygenase [Cupriavidus]PCH55086.1 MAG: Fe2+-dependent dioxygenase [Burkholderiaceae bacterium]AVA37013.1 Fe2+-dependent dioxygenase [Cupriavidus metallidurans]EKZ98771.1 Fe(II)-dependent oxygenase superfamily protein [Cupriavidus sp. HMR-1]KWR87068.1 PKHD-type hydroxylase [Cupriavidus sp. SHE]QBP11079.1 Fe2+-dependent dioxygenase [Cupriavidus metallidurans]